jgi:proline-specific peptidase
MCQELEYAREGFIETPWGRLWYGVAGNATKPPLLTLHGGPGVPHYYFMQAMGELVDQRPVIFYDQLGCGRSDRPTDESLWTAERFAEEVGIVVRELALTSFHLWGHSWGSAVAVLLALTHPPGLRSVTLASPILDIPNYREDLKGLLDRQPREVQAAIRDHPPDSPEFLAGLQRFYRAHLYTADPWDPCTEKALSDEEFGVESYQATVGANELAYTGNLRNRDDSARLGEIGVPTLLLCGREDIATPERSAAYQSKLPGSRLVVFEHSSHWYFEEERKLHTRTLETFLAKHD